MKLRTQSGSWVELKNENLKEFIKIVTDIKAETFKLFFDEKVIRGTLIKTDGHAFYPSAVVNYGSNHMVINQAKGFVSNDGVHTNNIKNL